MEEIDMRSLKTLVLVMAMLFAGSAYAQQIQLILEEFDPKQDKVLFETRDCDFTKLVKALEPFVAVKQVGSDNISWYEVKSEVLETNRKNGYVKIAIDGCAIDSASKITQRNAKYSNAFYEFRFQIPWEARTEFHTPDGFTISDRHIGIELFTNNLSPQEPFEKQFITWQPVSLRGWISVLRDAFEFPDTVDKLFGIKISIQPDYINGVHVNMPPPPPPNP